MTLFLWLAIGCGIGLAARPLARLTLAENELPGTAFYAVVGMAGAGLGSWLLPRLVGTWALAEPPLSMPGLLLPLAGAAGLLGAVTLFQGQGAP